MIEIEEFSNFVKEITANNSRLYKEEILRKYAESETIKTLLHFIYNPYIVTGISKKKIEKSVKVFICSPINNLNELLNYLQTYNTGTDINIASVQVYIRNQPEEYRELLRNIVTKNIQLGVEAVTINKCIPDLVPVFNIQLAENYRDFPKAIENKDFAITTKIDGGRIITIKEEGNVSFYTRAGQRYEGLVDIQKELESIDMDNFVLDGEITLFDKGNKNSKECYKETMKITRKDGEKHGVKILAFDWLPLEDFKAQTSEIPYYQRREQLDKFYFMQYIDILPLLYVGSEKAVIAEQLEKNIAAGEEGVMLNIWDAPYRFKRTQDLLKVKKMHDIDLKVIELEEGRNRFEGTLGAFVVDYKGNRLSVGSGISDELRKEVWENKDKYLGVTISVQYFEETTNDKGGISLRFPVFLDFRFDKPM